MVEQRSAQWFAMRCGKVTASRLSDVMAVRKDGKPTAARRKYLLEIVAEQLTGDVAEHFLSKPMQWGVEMEPEARSAYELARDLFVEEIAFVDHPRIEQAGASPDGLVGVDGLIEIKCPNTDTHLETLLRRDADPQYIPQMQWQMACTGRVWCDFVSYDPRMPDDLELFISRVERDDAMIAEMEAAVEEFLEEVAETIRAIRK